MTCHLNFTDTQIFLSALAQDFLEATTRKVGTDEEAVYKFAEILYHTGCQNELDHELYYSALDYGTLTQWRQVRPTRLNRSITSWILENELSGTELAKAQDMLRLGRDTHRESGFLYFSEGLSDITDLSSTGAKLCAVGSLVAMGALTIAASTMLVTSIPIAAALVLTVTAGAGMAIAGASILKNGSEIVWEYYHNDDSYKDDLRDFGNATTGFVLSAASLEGGKTLLSKEIPFWSGNTQPIPSIMSATETTRAVAPPIPAPRATTVPLSQSSLPSRPVGSTSMQTAAVNALPPRLKNIQQFRQTPDMLSALYSVYWRQPNGSIFYFHFDALSGKIFPISGFKTPPFETTMELMGILNPKGRIYVTFPEGTHLYAGELSPKAAAQIRGR